MSAIGIVGFCVWAHHMVMVGLDVDSRGYFSAATAFVSIPTSDLLYLWWLHWFGALLCFFGFHSP